MFSHIQLGCRDLETLCGFYDKVLGELGMTRLPEQDDGGPAGAGWGREGQRWPEFYVQFPFNGLPADGGNGTQVGFAAPSQSAVRSAWQQALANGGSDEGVPGLRPQYAEDFYAAYCRDPEGNKLCFVHAGELY